MDNQRARIANIRQMRQQLAALDQLHAGLVTATHAEGEHRAGPLRQIFAGQRMMLAAGQAGIGHPGNLRVILQKFRHLLRILHMALHAQRQGLDAGDGEIGVHRRHGRPEIAQPHRMTIDGEGEIAEGLVEIQPVIGRLRRGQRLEFVVLRPVELAGIDNRPTHRIAMAGQEFGGRMHDDVGAVVEGPAQIGRGHGVIDDQRHAGLMRDLRDGLDIDDHAARIGQAFDEDRLHLRRHRRAEILRVGGIDKDRVPAELLEAARELRNRSAIELAGGQEFVARLHEGEEGQHLRGMAGGNAGGAAPAFQAGDAFLQHRNRRVGQARIDVAEGLQVEQRGGMIHIVEHIGRGLVDRRGARARCRVGSGAGMHRERVETGLGVGHGGFLNLLAVSLFYFVILGPDPTMTRKIRPSAAASGVSRR